MQVLNKVNSGDQGDGCNCQISKKEECPLPGRCATRSVVYRATVRRHDKNTVDCYTGLTGDRFKDRYSKHTSDIRLGKSTASKLARIQLIATQVSLGIGLKTVTVNTHQISDSGKAQLPS